VASGLAPRWAAQQPQQIHRDPTRGISVDWVRGRFATQRGASPLATTSSFATTSPLTTTSSFATKIRAFKGKT